MLDPTMTGKPELTGKKKLRNSKTVHGNIMSIIASIGSVAGILLAGGDPATLATAVTGCVVTVYGNIVSILGRKNATEKIQK